jgi:hypothetical protein
MLPETVTCAKRKLAEIMRSDVAKTIWNNFIITGLKDVTDGFV